MGERKHHGLSNRIFKISRGKRKMLRDKPPKRIRNTVSIKKRDQGLDPGSRKSKKNEK